MTSRKKIILAATITVFAVLLTAGLFVAHYPRSGSNGPSIFHEWNTASTQFNGFSSMGNFVQSPDLHLIFVGTSTNGSLILTDTSNQYIWWQKSYGQGIGNAISFTNDGGFIVAGTVTPSQAQDAGNLSWLIRTDAGFGGNVQWSRTYEGLGLYGVVNASDGGFIALGRFVLNGSEVPGLLKVDAYGNVLWNKTYTSSEAPMLKLTSLTSTSDGGYAMVGKMQYSVYNATMRNGWFVKTDANGEVQVNRPFSMNGACVLNSVVQADDGGYLLFGATSESVDGTYLACIFGTDPDGHMQWSRINSSVGNSAGNGFEYCSAAKYKNGTYVVVGYLNGSGATIQNIDLAGNTSSYVTLAVAPQINYVITTIPTIPDNQNGYAVAGYKDGSIWLYTKTPYTVTPMPEKA
jgi:hypothetical protein